MKHVKNKNLVDFEGYTAYDREVIISYSNDNIIFYGWQFSTNNPKIIFQNIRKVYTTDGAHMNTFLHGPLFGFLGIDANDKISRLEMALYYDKKSDNTLRKFI